MEPLRIGTSRNQHNGESIVIGALGYPFADFSTIRRIAINTIFTPILNKTVLFLREVFIALVVLRIGARVERKPKLVVQPVKEVLRCSPLVR